jgi:hypothetical protein
MKYAALRVSVQALFVPQRSFRNLVVEVRHFAEKLVVLVIFSADCMALS